MGTIAIKDKNPLASLFGMNTWAWSNECLPGLLRGAGIKKGDKILSVAASGDQVLAFLTKGPSEIVAYDNNEYQLEHFKKRIEYLREYSNPILPEEENVFRSGSGKKESEQFFRRLNGQKHASKLDIIKLHKKPVDILNFKKGTFPTNYFNLVHLSNIIPAYNSAAMAGQQECLGPEPIERIVELLVPDGKLMVTGGDSLETLHLGSITKDHFRTFIAQSPFHKWMPAVVYRKN